MSPPDVSALRDGSAGQRLATAALMAGVLVAVAVLFDLTRPEPSPSRGLGGVLSGVRAEEVDLVVDLAKLFINWSFATIAANAYFLKAATEAKISLRSPERSRACSGRRSH